MICLQKIPGILEMHISGKFLLGHNNLQNDPINEPINDPIKLTEREKKIIKRIGSNKKGEWIIFTF